MSTDEPLLNVVDTTVLSNYARIRRPELLRLALGSSAVMTEAVRQELSVGEARGSVPRCDWSWMPTTVLTEPEQSLARQLGAYVDLGEATCLAVAINRAGTLVTDDRGARRQAKERHVSLSGSVGVLKRLVDSEQLEVRQAEEYLAAMIAEGYRSPIQRFSELRD